MMKKDKQQESPDLLAEAVGLLRRMSYTTEHGGSIRGPRVQALADSIWDEASHSYKLSLTIYAPGFDQAIFAGVPVVLRRDLSALHDLRPMVEQRNISAEILAAGDFLNAKGDFTGALAEYRAALAIHESTAREPAGVDISFNLARNYERIGDALVGKGDIDGALANYRQVVTIHQNNYRHGLTPDDMRRTLALSRLKISALLTSQGEKTEAQAMQQAASDTDHQLFAEVQAGEYLQPLPVTAQDLHVAPIASAVSYFMSLDRHGHGMLRGLTPGEYRFAAAVDWIDSGHSAAAEIRTVTAASGRWAVTVESLHGGRLRLRLQAQAEELVGREIYFALVSTGEAIASEGVVTLTRASSPDAGGGSWEGAVSEPYRLIGQLLSE